jgi:hypothetical protein
MGLLLRSTPDTLPSTFDLEAQVIGNHTTSDSRYRHAHRPQGKVRHTASFPESEDQILAMTPSGFAGAGSPDRVDALVWALTELSANLVVIDDSIGVSSVPAPPRLPDREYYPSGTAGVLSITFPG